MVLKHLADHLAHSTLTDRMVVQGVLKCLLFFSLTDLSHHLKFLKKLIGRLRLDWREMNRMTLTMQACRYRPISGTMDTPLGFGDNSCWWTLTNVALSKSCPALSVSVYCWANRRKPGSVQLWPAFALMCPWPGSHGSLCPWHYHALCHYSSCWLFWGIPKCTQGEYIPSLQGHPSVWAPCTVVAAETVENCGLDPQLCLLFFSNTKR